MHLTNKTYKDPILKIMFLLRMQCSERLCLGWSFYSTVWFYQEMFIMVSPFMEDQVQTPWKAFVVCCPFQFQFCRSVVSDSLQPHELQHARPPYPSPTPGVHPNPCPLSPWYHPTSHPLSSTSPPALNLSQHQGLFKWVSSSHQVAKLLKFQLQHQSVQWIFRADFL